LRCNGDAVYDWKCEAAKGGREVRLLMCGEWCGDCGTCDCQYRKARGPGALTGVRSRLSSSVADAAASMRSSQRFPMMAAAVCGSAENAFLS
jgi:hypothetical protein